MKLPTIKQLRYFVALTQTEHFGRAAEACFVSQSAFSNAIQELESLLEVQLVDRTNRSVTITAMGQQLATQARLCLRDVESLVEMARGHREPLTGELHLGVIPTIAPFLLPSALPKLRRKHPKLELYLHEDQSQRIYDRLMDGELDVRQRGDFPEMFQAGVRDFRVAEIDRPQTRKPDDPGKPVIADRCPP